ncbi:MAG: hypothetical protein IT190_09720 [Microbacteriaceae bacterium]|nr:hypothetical protein [Microbacteriaceae bacterium]
MTGQAILPPDVKSGGRRQSEDPRHTKPARGGGWPSIPPSKSFTLWLPNEHADALRAPATKQACSVATLIRQAVKEMLDARRSADVPRGPEARPVRALREKAKAQVRSK